MKQTLLTLFFLSQGSFAAMTYPTAKSILNNAPGPIQEVIESSPEIYEFPSTFDGQNSASYTGQIFRTVLINDLKSFMSSLSRGGWTGSAQQLMDALNSYFYFDSNATPRGPEFINGLSRHRVKVHDEQGNTLPVLEGGIYNGIQLPGKNLGGKIAGEDNTLRHGRLLGWQTNQGNMMPVDFIQDMFQKIVINASMGESFTVPNGTLPVQRIHAADTTPEGVNLTQMVQKFLHGSVAFSQAAGDYLSTDLGSKKGLKGDNTLSYKGSRNYTALEHHWDEAFGYFGAAADFLLYTDRQVLGKISLDTDGDGKISLLREKNLGLVVKNTSRMDLKVQQAGFDLSYEIMDAFLSGRQLITQKPEGYLKYVEAYAAVAIGVWEKTLAATTIHYINETVKQMNSYGTSDYSFMNHAKFWSEMKGFALSFQFNPISLLELTQFNRFHELVGDRPVLMTVSQDEIDAYEVNLYEARDILREAFGFSESNAEVF